MYFNKKDLAKINKVPRAHARLSSEQAVRC